jgi:hypothetical protein
MAGLDIQDRLYDNPDKGRRRRFGAGDEGCWRLADVELNALDTSCQSVHVVMQREDFERMEKLAIFVAA